MYLLRLYGFLARRFPWLRWVLVRSSLAFLMRSKLADRVRLGLESFGLKGDEMVKGNLFYLLRLVEEFLFILYHPRGEELLRERVQVKGLEGLEAALNKGKGVVLLGLHMGNFPWAIARLALEVPLCVVLRELEGKLAWRLLREGLERAGISWVAPRGSLLKVRSLLKEGKAVLYLVDQYLMGLSAEGRSRGLEEGLRFILEALGVPMFLFGVSEHNGLILLELRGPMGPEVLSSLREWVLTEVYNKPRIWLWWFRLGKNRR